MNALLYIFAYGALSLFIAIFERRRFRHTPALDNRAILVVHTTLLVSILASQYLLHVLRFTFPWHITMLSVAFYLAGTLFAICMLGVIGVGYGVSSFIQQLTLASAASLLLPSTPLLAVLILIAVPFAFAHYFPIKNGYVLNLILLFWGIFSVLVFSYTHDIWIVAGLHATIGSIFLRKFGFSNHPSLTKAS